MTKLPPTVLADVARRVAFAINEPPAAMTEVVAFVLENFTTADVIALARAHGLTCQQQQVTS